jgi:cytochrome P450
MEEGKGGDCFAAHIYRNRVEYGLNDAEAMFAGIISFSHLTSAVLNTIEGGSDTTRATLNIFAAALVTHPDFVVRARRELDSVCGKAERLPTFEDYDRLPLVTASIKETLRWKPFVESGKTHLVALTTGVVRVLIQDDQFEGYYFPKGTRFSMFPGLD